MQSNRKGKRENSGEKEMRERPGLGAAEKITGSIAREKQQKQAA